jgi:hypothetical protein
MLTSKLTRPLFMGSVLSRRWRWTALASAAGNGGVKHERDEEDVGLKGSPSRRAKTVEESAYPLPFPLTALTPGGIDAQARPAEPLR